jgi:hypothetical protein
MDPNLTTIYPNLAPIRANLLFPVHKAPKRGRGSRYKITSRNPRFGSVAIFNIDINDTTKIVI